MEPVLKPFAELVGQLLAARWISERTKPIDRRPPLEMEQGHEASTDSPRRPGRDAATE